VATVTVTVISCTTGEAEVSAEGVKVVVYPNPFADEAVMVVEGAGKVGNAEMKLFDVCGKEVRRYFISDFPLVIKREGLAEGLYYYGLKIGGTDYAVGKIVIQER
jgi:hypothetical protein